MKKIFLAIASFATLFCLAGCEKNFDPKIYGTLSTTNFPATESDYESELMICYVPFTTKWTHTLSNSQTNFYAAEGHICRAFDVSSDYCLPSVHSWGGSWLRLSQCYFTDLETISRGYNSGTPSYYDNTRDVTRFTQIIGEFRDADESVLSADKKRQFEAEARICRGLVMYYMLHAYGPLPFITDPEDVGTDKESVLVRPSLDEITEWITADFEYAAENAPETQSEKGRYTADYARYLLMRHYLNEGSHMAGYYQKAYDLKSRFTGNYRLFTDGGDSGNPYVELFRVANDFSCEDIMEVSCSPGQSGADTQGNFNPWFYYIADSAHAQQKVDDEGNATWASKAGGTPWSQTMNVDPAFFDTYEPGDLRRDVIVDRVYYGGTVGWIDRSNVGDLWDGFIINKYPFEESGNFQSNDIPLARWADVLLLYAEAAVRKDNAVSSEAVAAVNEVRARAGLAGLSSDVTSDVDRFLDALLLERGHELLYEGCRKIDLIRFGKYYTVMSSVGRTPTSEYWPAPDYSVDQAAESGYTLTQYYTRPDYDGPQLNQ